ELVTLEDAHLQLPLAHLLRQLAPVLLAEDLVVQARLLLDERLERLQGPLLLGRVRFPGQAAARADAEDVKLGLLTVGRARQGPPGPGSCAGRKPAGGRHASPPAGGVI